MEAAHPGADADLRRRKLKESRQAGSAKGTQRMDQKPQHAFRRTWSASPRAEERDLLISRLRLLGYTYRAIGEKVGMSAAGVMLALRRIESGRPGRT